MVRVSPLGDLYQNQVESGARGGRPSRSKTGLMLKTFTFEGPSQDEVLPPSHDCPDIIEALF